ncbi:MAG TPA: XdhC/CoxI family protein [Chryseosolibacter sp.]|nr:XdhC/CoxI family protein [Chryseosolibacter sp.]
MKEQKAIIDAYRKTDLSQRKVALATVVQVRGSSYRSPGARMLISDDGKWVGSISGGCLEGDALRKARQVMMDKKPLTVTYDTRENSNQNLGIGLGCNGVIDVLIEPVDTTDNHHPIKLFERLIASKEPVALATVFSNSRYTGEKLLISRDMEVLIPFSDKRLNDLVLPDLGEVFKTKRSEAKKYTFEEKPLEVFVELIQPSISLIIFGGGFDARPVSQLAKSLGWEVMVTDECVAHIAPVFFPTADKLSLCQRQFIDRDFNITPFTACVLMSHNYEYDRDVLKKLLLSPAPYIGILGPRKRFDKMMTEYESEGILLSGDDLHRIHSPIGLDIGAEAPDEIAVSIISEIQGKFANRSGGFLKYRNAPIHQRDARSDQVFKQVYLDGLNTKSAGK